MLNRFRIPEIVLGAYLTISLFAMGFVFGSLPHTGQTAEQQSTEKTGGASDDHKEQKNWWNDATADFTLGLVFVGMVQAGLFYVQLRLIRESLAPATEAAEAAKEAAEAAKLNAQAVIDGQRAHLYVIVTQHNVSDLISATAGFKYTDHVAETKMTGPTLAYIFKNYGKTPATLEMPMHYMTIQKDEPRGTRDYTTFDRAIEIIDGDGKESDPIATAFDERLFYGKDAKSLEDHDTSLYFFSEATYIDTFGRRHTVIHDFLYSAGRFHLIRRQETNHET